MYYTELTKNENTVRNAYNLTSEIVEIFHRSGERIEKSFLAATYMLYKISLYNNPFAFSFNKLFDGELELHDEVKLFVQEALNEQLWEQLHKLVEKYCCDDFAAAMLYGSSNIEGKDSESTPTSIINLANKILDVKPGERVADLCCGSGSFLISSAFNEPKANFHGYEINISRSVAALMKSELINANIEINLGDVFSLYEESCGVKYDKIFSNYPFGLKLKQFNGGGRFLESLMSKYPGISKATSSDWIFNSLICDMLEENGKAVAIMTNGSTWNSIDTPMRKHFVENGLIETIISLPGRMFSYTGIPTTLIVLSKNNKSVRMIDASELCHMGRRQNEFTAEDIQAIIEAINVDHEYSKTISIEEMRNNEYGLSLSRYSGNKVKFHNGAPFESVIKSITRGAPCTASQLDEMVSESVTNMQYLMLANIQNGLIDDKLPYLSYIDPKYEKYCLKNNSLILSKNGYPYKVAVAEVKENQQILANGNLYIIELDETKANPYYIKAFFDSEQGISVLKSITVGATIPNIGVDKLKKVEIPLPSLEEQEKIAERYQSTLDEISLLKLRLEKTINKLHHIFDEECA